MAEDQCKILAAHRARHPDIVRAAHVDFEDFRFVLAQRAQDSAHRVHLLAPRLDVAGVPDASE